MPQCRHTVLVTYNDLLQLETNFTKVHLQYTTVVLIATNKYMIQCP